MFESNNTNNYEYNDIDNITHERKTVISKTTDINSSSSKNLIKDKNIRSN